MTDLCVCGHPEREHRVVGGTTKFHGSCMTCPGRPGSDGRRCELFNPTATSGPGDVAAGGEQR